MAFFKFRKGGSESATSRQPPESIEAMRKRARHRLIGAGVLVLIGVVAFPLLFDTQPRPIAVDIPIEIPDRNKVKPLPLPAQPVTQSPVAAGPVTGDVPAEAAASMPAKVAAAEPAKVQPPAAAKAEAKPEPKAEAKPAPEPKPAAKPADDGAKARALLEGQPVQVASTTAEGRFVVQVGAFADATKVREVRQKVEHAGLKTYTNVAETKEGKRIRVRVGPFASRAEADKAAEKLKGLDLPAAILTL
jgi:DedD protein